MNRASARLASWGLWSVVALGCAEDRVLHEGPPSATCRCPDPSAKCVDGLCYKPGDCGESGCDAPFVCNSPHAETPACICEYAADSWSECAPRCDSQTDCGPLFECQQPEGICRYRYECLSDDLCPDDQVCMSPDVGEAILKLDPSVQFRSVCGEIIRDAGLGEACEHDEDCASGRCRGYFDNECTSERCIANADCGAGERCVSRVCAPAAGPCEYCDDGERLCIEDSAACVIACSTSSQCGDSDCGFDNFGLLYCREADRRCDDNEFFVDPTGYWQEHGPICALHQACWASTDCPETYRCLPVWGDATGYCARSAP